MKLTEGTETTDVNFLWCCGMLELASEIIQFNKLEQILQ